MAEPELPELWEWAEYYCPWCYITTVRLHAIRPEYEGQVRLRIRPFPLEVLGGEAAPRDILEQEWWLAAQQEPAAAFAPYTGQTWPTTTLPAFEAAWCMSRLDPAAIYDFDLRVRRAFFGESRDISQRDVLLDLATKPVSTSRPSPACLTPARPENTSFSRAAWDGDSTTCAVRRR